jgi:hypothetical protein
MALSAAKTGLATRLAAIRPVPSRLIAEKGNCITDTP